MGNILSGDIPFRFCWWTIFVGFGIAFVTKRIIIHILLALYM